MQKVSVPLGGVPTPDPLDENKALVADGSGSYSWQVPIANIESDAVDVSFDNTLAQIPNSPTEVQAAVEETYFKIPAFKIVKLAEKTGGAHTLYKGVPVIREDGQIVYIGDRYDSTYGTILTSCFNWSETQYSSLGPPLEVGLPEFGRKVFSISMGNQGVLIVAGTQASPRSELWVSGRRMGAGTGSPVTTPTRVFTAASSSEYITQIFTSNYNSDYFTNWYVREDGKLYASGYRNFYQLGTGSYNDTSEASFVLSQSGDLDYAGGQVVTRVFSNGRSSWAEVTSDSGATYQLLAVGRNEDGQLGIDATGAVDGAIRQSCPTWKTCQANYPSAGDLVSTGGPFKKILGTDDTPDYRGNCFVLTYTGDLFYSGKSLGGGTSKQVFTRISSDVVDFALTGGSLGSVIYAKSDGSLYGAGHNVEYVLGVGNNYPVPISTPISLGAFGPSMKVVECFGAFGSSRNSFFIRLDTGVVYAAGDNQSSHLGTYTESADDEQATQYSRVTSWRKVYLPEPLAEGGLYCINSITEDHSIGKLISSTYFLGQSGALYACGHNRHAALGLPLGLVTVGTPVPVSIPPGHWISGRWDFLTS